MRSLLTRSSRVVLAGLAAAVVAVILPTAALAAVPWGPESPPFNIEVVLRPVTGGDGFGLVKFRQPNDGDKIIHLDTWLRDLAPNHEYLLQRAVDATLDGTCPVTGWLTLGEGLTPRSIATGDDGSGRAPLFRNVGMLPVGARFDITFQVVDAVTGLPVLASGCYRFTVSL
jgi:hypothetical protein